MKKTVYFHEAAEEELTAALEWYRQRSERAAVRFADETSRAIEWLRNSTQQFPHLVGTARRALLNRFPFALVFRETQHGIEILAVAHAKRRPGYWRDRTEE